MTRLRTSRPSRSVPNHALWLGGASMSSKFGSSGACGAITPAKTATHDDDGDDEAAENDRASEGPADAPAEARHLTWGIGSHEHGLACELQRRDARRARRGLSRPAPSDDEGNFSRGKWPGLGASRTMSACSRHRRRCPGRWRALPSTSDGSSRARLVLTWADGGAFLAVLLWGVSFPVMKALMGVMDPVTLVVVLWTVALTILGAVLRLRGPWRWPAASCPRSCGPAWSASR